MTIGYHICTEEPDADIDAKLVAKHSGLTADYIVLHIGDVTIFPSRTQFEKLKTALNQLALPEDVCTETV